MGQWIHEFLNSSKIVPILAVLCIIAFIGFVIYAVTKEGRDEHGRAIMGSACFYGAIVLFVAINIFTQFTYTVTSNMVIFSNSIRLVFLSFFLTVDIAILILRKLR